MLGFAPISSTPISALPAAAEGAVAGPPLAFGEAPFGSLVGVAAPVAPAADPVEELAYAIGEFAIGELANEAASTTKEESASNAVTFGQQLAKNFELNRSVSNSITFSQEALNNFKLESVSNVITFAQELLDNFRLEAVSNSLTFGQVLLDNFRLESVTNTLTLAQLLAFNIEINLVASNVINLGQVATTNIIQVSASNEIVFNPFVSLDWELNVSFEHTIQFNHDARRTFEESVSNTVTFVDTACQEHPAENIVSFDQTAVGSVGPAIEQSITFAQTAVVEIDLNIAQSDAIVFVQSAVGFIETNCDLYEYTPFGNLPAAPTLSTRTTIVLDDGVTTLTFRNPTFGNTDQVETFQVINRTRGGTSRPFASSIWPKNITLSMSVNELTRVEALAIQAFYKTNLGKEITFTDMEDRDWTGILLNVDVPINDGGGVNESFDCRYSLELEFIGDLV